MTEQQYRVIADRDKGDDPQWDDVQIGDRYVGIATERGTPLDPVVRIERPAPATGLPAPMTLTAAEQDSYTAAMAEPSLPTREQIAEAIEDAIEVDIDTAADAVLRLLEGGRRA